MTEAGTNSGAYAPGQHPDLPPPKGSAGATGCMRGNLFSSPFNTAVTILAAILLYELITSIAGWFVLDAVIDAGSKADCRQAGSGA
mgnify:FL=1